MPAPQLQDAFVGSVAIGVGIFALTAALSNQNWFFRLRKAQRIEQRWGRPRARAFYAALGVLLLTLGVLIASGGLRPGGLKWRWPLPVRLVR